MSFESTRIILPAVELRDPLSYGSVIMPIFMGIREGQMHFLPKGVLVGFIPTRTV